MEWAIAKTMTPKPAAPHSRCMRAPKSKSNDDESIRQPQDRRSIYIGNAIDRRCTDPRKLAAYVLITKFDQMLSQIAVNREQTRYFVVENGSVFRSDKLG
jgi:hypothetical protein